LVRQVSSSDAYLSNARLACRIQVLSENAENVRVPLSPIAPAVLIAEPIDGTFTMRIILARRWGGTLRADSFKVIQVVLGALHILIFWYLVCVTCVLSLEYVVNRVLDIVHLLRE